MAETGYAVQAIQAVQNSIRSYCKFLTANDTGLTGGHQSGIHISKAAWPILFQDRAGIKGELRDRNTNIHWQDGSVTNSRFIYYGQKTRNEYRITNFGRGFEFLHHVYTGALWVLTQRDAEGHDYDSFVLNTDDEIEEFLSAFGMTPAETNRLLDHSPVNLEERELQLMDAFIEPLNGEFPDSRTMSEAAQNIQNTVFDHIELIQQNPDKKLLEWTECEYRLFRRMEHVQYIDVVRSGFENVDLFVEFANKVLNRRKSRAGKSLEHHLAALFDYNGVEYTEQCVTEGKKRPDFIFPSAEAYHTASYPAERLVSLAAKTTCKDRWRQVLNEADRLRDGKKYLCTLQQGISITQMDEMEAENVVLVVPKPYISTYPTAKQDNIWSISAFIQYVKDINVKP